MRRRKFEHGDRVILTRLLDNASHECHLWEVSAVLTRWIMTTTALTDWQRAYLIQKAGDLTTALLWGNTDRHTELERAFGITIVRK